MARSSALVGVERWRRRAPLPKRIETLHASIPEAGAAVKRFGFRRAPLASNLAPALGDPGEGVKPSTLRLLTGNQQDCRWSGARLTVHRRCFNPSQRVACTEVQDVCGT